jgi:hypothetical protein
MTSFHFTNDLDRGYDNNIWVVKAVEFTVANSDYFPLGMPPPKTQICLPVVKTELEAIVEVERYLSQPLDKDYYTKRMDEILEGIAKRAGVAYSDFPFGPKWDVDTHGDMKRSIFLGREIYLTATRIHNGLLTFDLSQKSRLRREPNYMTWTYTYYNHHPMQLHVDCKPLLSLPERKVERTEPMEEFKFNSHQIESIRQHFKGNATEFTSCLCQFESMAKIILQVEGTAMLKVSEDPQERVKYALTRTVSWWLLLIFHSP